MAEELAKPDTPATESTLWRSEGGKTMSRRAFGEVVRGWPPESRVSSRSYSMKRWRVGVVLGDGATRDHTW